MDVPSALRAARRRAGLTQASLALRAGTSQAAVSNYESGHKQPSLDTLTRLLAAADAQLTVEPRRRREPTPADHALTARRLVDVLALAEALPTRHQPRLRYPRLAR